jgi:hypothetical protein
MADLLGGLELSLHFTAGASDRLRAHVERIDEYMQIARQQQGMHHQHQQATIIQAPYADASSSQVVDNNASPQQSHILGPMSDHSVPAKFNSGMLGPGNRIIVDTSGMIGPPVTAATTTLPDVEAGPGLLDLEAPFEFQIPPELLEDWPWPFDLGSYAGMIYTS